MHMGEMIEKDKDVYGDAVNVASRIQAIGTAGSILVSMTIEEELKIAFDAPSIVADTETELKDIYATKHELKKSKYEVSIIEDVNNAGSPITTHDKRFVDAITEGLYQSMEQHDNLVLMGQDIGLDEGVFRVTGLRATISSTHGAMRSDDGLVAASSHWRWRRTARAGVNGGAFA